MIKRLTKSGNSYALVIDRSILELLNITPDTPLRLSTPDGKSLQVTPAQSEIQPQDMSEAMDRFNRKFGRMMKRLAE